MPWGRIGCRNLTALRCFWIWTCVLDTEPWLSICCLNSRIRCLLWWYLFNKALAVVSAIKWAAHLPDCPHCILVQMDSMNTVNIFHSLAPQPGYVLCLLFTVNIMMDFGVGVCIVHIPGLENVIIDALSWRFFDVVRKHNMRLYLCLHGIS